MKRFHWFEILLVVAIMGAHLYAAFSAPQNFSMNWFSRDDAYYYFKVAQNIVAGHGSTFDGINPTNGYHPLWLVICIPIFALAQFDLVLPLRILLVVMAALSAVTSILLFRLLRKAISEPVAILGASFWGLSMLIHPIVTQPGLETGIAALAIVLFLYLLQGFDEKWRGPTAVTIGDIVRLALAALLVLFSRLDLIYLALIAGIWIIFRRTPIRYLLPIDLLATLSIIVLAYIQRTELSLYLQAYSDSAILAAGIIFAIQTIVFYFAGLYQHPKGDSSLVLLRKILVAVNLSALISAGILLGLSALGWSDLPRAVPLIYWAGALLSTLVLRFSLRAISPWPAPLPTAGETVQAQFRQSWKPWLTEGAVYYGILGAALGLYLLVNRLLFATPLPVSGQIKRWWGTLPGTAYGGGTKSILDVFALDPLYSQAWSIGTNWIRALVQPLETHFWTPDRMFWTVVFLLAILWFVLVLPKRRRALRQLFQTGLIPLLLSAELQAFFYGSTGYAGEQEWYWVMQMLGLTILAAMTVNMIFEILPSRRFSPALTWAVCLTASAYLAVGFGTSIYTRMPYQEQPDGQSDMQAIRLLEKYTKPGAVIGITGGGDIGYFIKDRTIVNMDGLINSYAYFEALQQGKGGEYLRKKGVRYVFGSYSILTEGLPYRFNLDGQLIKVRGVPAYGNRQLLRLVPKP